MINLSRLTLWLAICVALLPGAPKHLKGKHMEGQEITRKGQLGGFEGDSSKFSGVVHVQMLFKSEKWRHFGGGLVSFEPKARSAWHTHPAGQTLIVTKGVIYTGTQDGKVSVAHEGDVISCPPGVKHWHGAGLDSGGSHIALTGVKDGVNVIWGEKVSDAEYMRAMASIHNKASHAPHLTKTAQHNFDTLFKDASLPLSQSDPDFVSAYLNFSLGEALTQSGLSTQEYMQLVLASLVATPALGEYKNMLGIALKNHVNPVAIKEILYQAVPYVGFGRVYDFLEATNVILSAHGFKLPLEAQKSVARNQRQEKGLAIQRKFFGEMIDKYNAAAPKDEQHIRRFLSENCFGDYYTREGLALPFRELLTFVYLTSLGGADAQLKAHVSGNIAAGNDRKKLIGVITALIPYIGYPKGLNALNAIDSIAPAK
ncbi:cupin domain-containing carboxymuconolactone decarboxylase family protein [Helicobacter suis]|uniref:cupin domain-containing carboxymuconolactone decarboxylase family protein n=1 Tax=Helicobacter suis TaxID=104628 RepID=UPI0031FC3253